MVSSGFPTSLMPSGSPLMPSHFRCLWSDQESRAPRTTAMVRVANAEFQHPSDADKLLCPTFFSVHYGLLHFTLCQPLAPVCYIVCIQGTFLPFLVFSRGVTTPLSPLSGWMETPLEKCCLYPFWLLCRHAHQVTHFSHAYDMTCSNTEHSLLTA